MEVYKNTPENKEKFDRFWDDVEQALNKPTKTGLPQNIKDDFRTLHNTILLTMAQDSTSIRDAETYRLMGYLLTSLESTFDWMLKENG